MPIRPFNRQQAWLLPPTLGELISEDHPARFVATFVDMLDRSEWLKLGIGLEGEVLGALSYHPRALLGVWLYGFMTGVRSCRKLETACRDQIPYLWLTGWQHPDHNTLWRYYLDHRQQMRHLLKYTVATAIESGLVDLAVQSLDGTKVAANAEGDRTYGSDGLKCLLDRVDTAISELEAQNEGGDDTTPPRMPEELQEAHSLRQRVQDAMKRLDKNGMQKINMTDNDAQLMKGRNRIMPDYNAQAMVSPLSREIGRENIVLITAADVCNNASDSGQLIPMLEQAEDLTRKRVSVTLADGGYHTAAALEAGEHRDQV
jgi:transposase